MISKSSPGSMTMTSSYSAGFWPGMLPRKQSLMAHALSMASSRPGLFQRELVWIQPVRNTLLGSEKTNSIADMELQATPQGLRPGNGLDVCWVLNVTSGRTVAFAHWKA